MSASPETMAGDCVAVAPQAGWRAGVWWSADDAIAEVWLSEDTEELLTVVDNFARQRCLAVALFLFPAPLEGAPRRAARRWTTSGSNEPWVVYETFPSGSSLAQVFELRAPWLGPLPAGDPMARWVGRAPTTALLLPLVVGERVVGALYGDRGAADIPPDIFQEFVVVLGHAGAMLRRLARQRARGRGAAAPGGHHRPEVPSSSAYGASVPLADPLHGAFPLSAGTMAARRDVPREAAEPSSRPHPPEPL